MTRRGDVLLIILLGVVYMTIGIATAALAGAAGSSAGVTGWRLTAWILSAAVFLWHIVVSRPRHGDSAVHSATRVALAVALGACLLAIAGPVRSHWGEPHPGRLLLLAVVLWPVITGLPAFLVALVAEHLLGRLAVPRPVASDEAPDVS